MYVSLVHDEGWRIEWWGREREVAFGDPKGTAHIAGAGKPPRLPPNPVATGGLVTRDPDAMAMAMCAQKCMSRWIGCAAP